MLIVILAAVSIAAVASGLSSYDSTTYARHLIRHRYPSTLLASLYEDEYYAHEDHKEEQTGRRLQQDQLNFVLAALLLDPFCVEPKSPVFGGTCCNQEGQQSTSYKPSWPADAIVTVSDRDQDVDISFVDVPSDTIFMESVAINPTFDPDSAYIVIQRPGLEKYTVESYLYAIRPDKVPQAQLVMGPLKDPSQSTTQLSVWGSSMTDDGKLIACTYNRNSLSIFDVKNKNPVAIQEIQNVVAPNDVAIAKDPTGNTNNVMAYVAAGTMIDIPGDYPFAGKFASAPYGRVLQVNLETGHVSVLVDHLLTVVGVEVTDNGLLIISQLFNMITLNLTSTTTQSLPVVWEGFDGRGKTWSSDNIGKLFHDNGSHRPDNFIMTPSFGDSTTTFTVQNVLAKTCVGSPGTLAVKLQTAEDKGLVNIGKFGGITLVGNGVAPGTENTDDPKPSLALLEEMQNPEQSLRFSNTYISEPPSSPEPVRLVVMSPNTTEAYHFELHLPKTLTENPPYTVYDPYNDKTVLGKRHYFNNKVTHFGHLKKSGYLVGINFEVPRVLLWKDNVIWKHLNVTKPAEGTTPTDGGASPASKPTSGIAAQWTKGHAWCLGALVTTATLSLLAQW